MSPDEAYAIHEATAGGAPIAPTCDMRGGQCPHHRGHTVRMLPDGFQCSTCGDTGRRPCLCSDCPDRQP